MKNQTTNVIPVSKVELIRQIKLVLGYDNKKAVQYASELTNLAKLYYQQEKPTPL